MMTTATERWKSALVAWPEARLAAALAALRWSIIG